MESTLSLSFKELCADTGQFLGWGRGAAYGDTAWSEADKSRIETCVKSGLRQFYIPATPYEWSFLKPVASITLPADSSVVDLPDDFGHLDGGFIISSDDNVRGWEVPAVGPGMVTRSYAVDSQAIGWPDLIAVRPKRGTDVHHGQRFELHIFPISDQEYTITLQYSLLPNALDGTRPFAYGGMAHAETVRTACLMAAEEYLDNNRGIWAQKFVERLAASIAYDMKNKSALIGYNGDRSDELGHFRRRRWHDQTITFNGVLPD